MDVANISFSDESEESARLKQEAKEKESKQEPQEQGRKAEVALKPGNEDCLTRNSWGYQRSDSHNHLRRRYRDECRRKRRYRFDSRRDYD